LLSLSTALVACAAPPVTDDAGDAARDAGDARADGSSRDAMIEDAGSTEDAAVDAGSADDAAVEDVSATDAQASDAATDAGSVDGASTDASTGADARDAFVADTGADAGTDARDAGADARDASADTVDAGPVDAGCMSMAACDDRNACTTDTCVMGGCVNTPRVIDDGDVCTTDSCDPMTGVAHAPIANCCTTPAMCASGVCTANRCVAATCSDGMRNGTETAVDCGGGGCPPCVDGRACVVGGDCRSGLCAGNVCVECVVPTTCPGMDTECRARACTSNRCGFRDTTVGTVTTAQTPGDCRRNECDGMGVARPVAFAADLPDDGLQCTVDTCAGATPTFTPQMSGFTCSQSGGIACDGAEQCLAAPLVTATSPADGVSALVATVSVTFSTAMNATTITGQTSGGACSGSVQLSLDNFATCEAFAASAPVTSMGGTVATFTVRPGMLANRAYKLRVTTAVRNTAGLALAATYTHAAGFNTNATAVRNETNAADEADYCVVQFPTTITAQQGTMTPTVYARLYEAGVTEAPGASATVRAQLGVGPATANPQWEAGWTWSNATFNVQVGNDDEYQGSFVVPPAGSWRYAYRVSFDGGMRWTYCDTNGAGSNGGMTFELSQLGSLTSTP
jgi:hypothetical protein